MPPCIRLACGFRGRSDVTLCHRSAVNLTPLHPAESWPRRTLHSRTQGGATEPLSPVFGSQARPSASCPHTQHPREAVRTRINDADHRDKGAGLRRAGCTARSALRRVPPPTPRLPFRARADAPADSSLPPAAARGANVPCMAPRSPISDPAGNALLVDLSTGERGGGAGSRTG